MTLNFDGTLDGKVTIQKGQGISQAIAAELGLSEQDCKKLGSIWHEIIAIAEDSDNYDTNSGKTYSKNQTLQVGDIFVFKSDSFNKIIEKVNKELDKEIKTLDNSSAENNEENKNALSEDDQIANEIGYSKDKIPSVLLRNTAGISALVMYRAIKDPKIRKEVLPKLTPEQKQALEDAGKKFDEAKAKRKGISDDIKKNKESIAKNKNKIQVIENAEKKAAEAQQKVDKATKNVNAEKEALKNNPEYQKLKKEYNKNQKAINALKKKGNLTKPQKTLLKKLETRQKELNQLIDPFETKLKKARAEQRQANTELKNAQIEKQAEAANKKYDKAKKQEQVEKGKLSKNKEYQEVEKKLNKLKKYRNKSKTGTLTPNEKQELKELEKQEKNLKKRKQELSKEWRNAKSNLETAKSEKEALSCKNKAKAKSDYKSKIKKGKNNIKINLRKIPKGKIETLKASLNKVKTTGKVAGQALRGVGKVAKPIMAVVCAFDIYNAYQTGGTEKAVRQTAKLGTSLAGGAAGAKGGAMAGGAIGTAICPGIGTAVGGFIGGIVGGIAGWWAGEQVYDGVESYLLPDGSSLNVEEAQNGELNLELSAEELEILLKECPELEEAIEFEE